MQRKKFLMISSVLLLSITISGCSMFRSPEKQVVVQSVEVERKIPLQSNPKPVTLGDANFYVVTADNWDEFIENYKKENGDPWVFYAMAVRSYETLALNVAEVGIYLQQQKQIIIYYENSISGTEPEPEETEETEEK
jgi:hypothetical protein